MVKAKESEVELILKACAAENTPSAEGTKEEAKVQLICSQWRQIPDQRDSSVATFLLIKNNPPEQSHGERSRKWLAEEAHYWPKGK